MSGVDNLESFLDGFRKRNINEDSFHQAVEETAQSVFKFYQDNKKYRDAYILERSTEPDRIITFRVSWEDDQGSIRVNRGWRVQFNNILGPYKGGLRFSKHVDLSTLKFLGFEQCIKNALTGLPMGGAKGGANFNPKDKSEREVMRFCQSFMQELYHHIGPYRDIPAGDLGVGQREISFLFGHFIKLTNTYQGVITGKDLTFGGSSGRKEATGHGCVYFLEEMLNVDGESVKDKNIVISGAGVVALYAAEKIIQHGGKVLALSDSRGTLYDPEGISPDKLELIKNIKEVKRGYLDQYCEKVTCAEYRASEKPWDIACDIAMPCAIERDIDLESAKKLAQNGTKFIVEGANMPLTREATKFLCDNGVIIAPDKAANAGGVAVSCFEQTQNLTRVYWPLETVDKKLREIMQMIHKDCLSFAHYNNQKRSYIDGANISGFKKLADAMVAAGVK